MNMIEICTDTTEIFQKNNPGSFVCAALPSICTHMDAFESEYSKYANNSQINSFLHNNVNKFLSSVGVAIDKEKGVDDNLINKYSGLLDKMICKKYLKDCIIFIDSGGYQVQCGLVPREQIPKFIDLYYNEFVKNNFNKYTYAFTLDLAPGFIHCPYKSWKDLEDLNLQSCRLAASMTKEIRNKFIYVHHFRTPKLYKIYQKILEEVGSEFNHFGTGGLVSMANTKNTPAHMLYLIPLIDIIKTTIKNKKNQFIFHVLGETEFKYILMHCFIEKHIREIYGIDIKITFDSSSIFKILGMGRYTYCLDDNNMLWKLSLRSETLHNTFQNETNEDSFYNIINNMVKPYNMKEVIKDIDPMYKKDGKFNKIFYIYGIFQLLKLFKNVQDISNNIVEELYPIYKGGNEIKFGEKLNMYLAKFNNGKDSKKIDEKTISVWNSLKLIEKLDTDYTNYMVNKYLCYEETQEMPDKH